MKHSYNCKMDCDDCRRVLTHLQFAVESGLTYISTGNGVACCQRCGFREDLRMGACFRCADFVKGKNHGNGIHELWDRDRPDNRWIVTLKEQP